MPLPAPLHPDTGDGALYFAANRAALTGTIGRWLIHDLRNPFQVLSLIPDLANAQGGSLEPNVRGMLEDGLSQLGDATVLLDELLRQPPKDAVPVPIALGEMLAFVRRLHAKSRMGIEVTVAEPDRSLPAVRGVEHWTLHLILSLVQNGWEAVAAREQGSVRVTVTAAGDVVRLQVRDDGPGIVAAMHDRLFKPWHTTKRYAPIAGLGLVTAKMLAETMSGGVRVAETGPTGTVMEATLPVWPD